MSGSLGTTVTGHQIGQKVLVSKNPWRAVTVVAGEGQDAEVERLLTAEGFDPEAEDFIVMRLLIVPSGQSRLTY